MTRDLARLIGCSSQSTPHLEQSDDDYRFVDRSLERYRDREYPASIIDRRHEGWQCQNGIWRR